MGIRCSRCQSLPASTQRPSQHPVAVINHVGDRQRRPVRELTTAWFTGSQVAQFGSTDGPPGSWDSCPTGAIPGVSPPIQEEPSNGADRVVAHHPRPGRPWLRGVTSTHPWGNATPVAATKKTKMDRRRLPKVLMDQGSPEKLLGFSRPPAGAQAGSSGHFSNKLDPTTRWPTR